MNQMVENKKPVTVLHSDITEWKSNVELVRFEIATFQKQLGEFVRRNNHREVLKDVEHFQNQFIRQLEVSDELFHDLKAANRKLAKRADTGTDSEFIYAEDDAILRDTVDTYDKLFRELKNEFHSFLEKWL
jgi:type II secretory pathway predicted ATPase ExeA